MLMGQNERTFSERCNISKNTLDRGETLKYNEIFEALFLLWGGGGRQGVHNLLPP